jgi:DNA-binding response OmpR family regulator
MSNMLPNDPSVLPDVHGIQAVSEARTHPPHVILLDLGLPGRDGGGGRERLKRNRLLSTIPGMVWRRETLR